MKKLFVISFVVFLFSCSVQKDCNKRMNLTIYEVRPNDSTYIKVERSVDTYYGRYVRSNKGKWYRYCWGNEFQIGDTILVYSEWKGFPPCY